MLRITRACIFAVGLVVCLLVSTQEGSAEPLTVDVLSTQYTADLYTRVVRWDGVCCGELIETTDSRTTSSLTPISDALQVGGEDWARATVDMFSISAWSSALPDLSSLEFTGSSTASAEAALQFSPLQDGRATIGIDLTGGGNFLSEGFVSLYDITTDQLLWNYWWGCCFDGNIPWTSYGSLSTLALEQDFLSSHQYTLTMYTRTSANKDSSFMTMQVSGLQKVPEPSSLFLFGTACSG
jgi:hypothetical protein